MAEVFGLAAGGIGVAPVALELAKTIKKLKDYCRDIKSARDDIRSFVDEVDALSTVLSQLDTLGLLDCPSSSAALQRCHDLCKKANTTLSGIVTELHQGLKHSGRRTELAFPLRRERVQQLTDRVTSAKSSLLLACNVYLMWQTKTQAVIQQQMISEVLTTIRAQRDDHDKSFEDLLSGNSAIKQSVLSLKTRDPATGVSASSVEFGEARQAYRMDEMLTRIWNVCSLLATKGWMHHFRSYRVVFDHYDDPAFLAIEKGDLASLQRLLCTGEASIDDQTLEGRSMLTHASSFRQMHVVRWLQQMVAGSKAVGGEHPCRIISAYFLCKPASSEVNSVTQMSEDVGFLIESLDLDTDYLKDHVLLSHWARTMIHPWMKAVNQWSAEDVFAVLRWNLENLAYRVDSEILLRSLLDLTKRADWRRDVWQYRDECGYTFMHALADAYILCVDLRAVECQQLLRGFLREGLQAGAYLCALFDCPEEQHLQAQCGRCDYGYFHRLRILDITAVRSWVQALADESVDLVRYGEIEEQQRRSQQRLNFYGVATYGLTYGPRPEDWMVHWEHPGDRFAGIFWDLVEHPERHLPGAWPDREEEFWEDELSYGFGLRRLHRLYRGRIAVDRKRRAMLRGR